MYYFSQSGKNIDMKRASKIEKIRNNAKDLMGKTLKADIKGARGKINTVIGNVSAVNDNILVMDVNDGIRKHISLSYSDLISGRARLEEVK